MRGICIAKSLFSAYLHLSSGYRIFGGHRHSITIIRSLTLRYCLLSISGHFSSLYPATWWARFAELTLVLPHPCYSILSLRPVKHSRHRGSLRVCDLRSFTSSCLPLCSFPFWSSYIAHILCSRSRLTVTPPLPVYRTISAALRCRYTGHLASKLWQ